MTEDRKLSMSTFATSADYRAAVFEAWRAEAERMVDSVAGAACDFGSALGQVTRSDAKEELDAARAALLAHLDAVPRS